MGSGLSAWAGRGGAPPSPRQPPVSTQLEGLLGCSWFCPSGDTAGSQPEPRHCVKSLKLDASPLILLPHRPARGEEHVPQDRFSPAQPLPREARGGSHSCGSPGTLL